MEFDQDQVNDLSDQAARVIGPKFMDLIPQQRHLYNGCMTDLLKDHKGVASTVTDAEIEGVWEMVTEHLFPPELVELSKLMESQQKEGDDYTKETGELAEGSRLTNAIGGPSMHPSWSDAEELARVKGSGWKQND